MDDTVTRRCPACLRRFTGPEGNVALRVEVHRDECAWIPDQHRHVDAVDAAHHP